MRKERLKDFTQSESKLFYHVLKLYGWNIYQYHGGHFITPNTVESYKDMMKQSFIFIEFLSESLPMIQICVRGKITKVNSSVKVLYSNEDVRLMTLIAKDTVFKNKTGEEIKEYTGVYEGVTIC